MVGQFDHYFDRYANELLDEAMAEAELQLTGSSLAMGGNNIVLYLVFGLVLLLVLAGLAIVIGKMRRQRDEFDEGEDIFEQRFNAGGFDQPDDPFSNNDGFNSFDLKTDDGFDQAPLLDDPATEPFDLPEAAPVDEPAPLPVMEEAKAPAENVVPLRAPEPQPEVQPMQRVEAPLRRDAAMQMTSGSDNLPTGDYDYGATASASDNSGGSDWSRGYEDTPTGSSRGSFDDEDTPYIAPFIRDYIEESERRQSHRLDDMRDDMRRQMSSVREEQSSRLDLFLSSIDRKLSSTINARRGEVEDGASTRRRIDGLNDQLDRMSQNMERHGERLLSLSRSVEEQFGEIAPMRGEVRGVHEDVLSFRRDVEANTLAIGQLRDDIDVMKEDFSRMERSFLERAQADQGVTMRLADVIRGTLDDDEFRLGARLSNGHQADALIMLAGGRACVAVDGRFPVECFNRLPSKDAVRKNMKHAKAAEDDFRRTVLRAIFACSDRCIVDGETTDSAILFMPSEAAYTILHDRFPDLVRDSHRARVWLTSPSTLMGTLALLHNVFDRDAAPEPQPEPDLPPMAPDYADQADDEPYYSGPDQYDDYGDYDDRYAEEDYREEPLGLSDDEESLEDRLEALRQEERELQEEIARQQQRRAAAPAREERRPRRYRSAEPEQREVDPFEARLERFSLDLGEEEREPSMEDRRTRKSFRRDRDDDLR